jgi:DNA-binding transcriptional regulator/RsmH inhibitor MraZ
MGSLSVFSGKYKYSLDEKNRINFKKILNKFVKKSGSIDELKDETFHLFKDFVKVPSTGERFPVFYIFNEEKWAEFYEIVEEEFKDDDKMSKFNSQYCDESGLDNDFRITFPKEFTGFIKAKKNLFLQGYGDKLQVWSQENFDRYSEILSSEESTDDFHGLLSKKRK